jgi:predicted nucleic acid-binding protein
MILLDTNVISAMMRLADEPVVEQWLNMQPIESVWTTSITVFEVRFGLALMARGRHRDRLEGAFARAIHDVLGERVLPFDRGAAEAAAEIAVRQKRAGRPVEIRDVQIAAVAAARKATLATRNTRHFEIAGIALVNPWQG